MKLLNRFLTVSMVGLTAATAAVAALAVGGFGQPAERIVVASALPVSPTVEYRFDLVALDFFPVTLLPAGDRQAEMSVAALDHTNSAVMQPLVLRTTGDLHAGAACSGKLLRLAEVEADGGRYGIILAPADRPNAFGDAMRLFPAGKVLAQAPGTPFGTIICRNPSV